MKKIILTLATILTLFSCQKEKVQPTQPTNNEVKIEIITDNMSNTELWLYKDSDTGAYTTISIDDYYQFYADTNEYMLLHVWSKGVDFNPFGQPTIEGETNLTIKIDNNVVYHGSTYFGDQYYDIVAQ